MGLDMYLYEQQYVSGWNDSNRTAFEAILKATGITPSDESPHFLVKGAVAYWRKANAIHKWFVDNVQQGVDDCEAHYVTREDLQNLLARCEGVLSGKEEATEALPTTSGFFFGSTDYGADYLSDIEYTQKTLKKVLGSATAPSSDFYYRSSW